MTITHLPPLTSPTLSNEPSLTTAEELHGFLLKAFRLDNHIRLRFADALLAMKVGKLYLKLGYSNITQYAAKHFAFSRSQTYEYLRTAKSLHQFETYRDALVRGDISWSTTRELTRLENPNAQGEWVQFAKENDTEVVRCEIRHAIENGRQSPRSGKGGPSDDTIPLHFELTPHEHDLAEKALAKVQEYLMEPLDGNQVNLHDALMFALRFVLENGATADENRASPESPYTILYHRCPDCRKSSVCSRDGRTEIEPVVVDRIEPDAEKIAIRPEDEEVGPAVTDDQDATPAAPTSASLRRKVLARDGGLCSNPGCGHRLNLQAHHIKFRSQGGATSLTNETLVCPVCHALIHAGLLELRGNPLIGLEWKARGDTLSASLQAELVEFAKVPIIKIACQPADLSISAEKSTAVDSITAAPPLAADHDLVRAMIKLGFSRLESRSRVSRARRALGLSAAEGEVMKQAVRGSPAR